MIFAYVFVCWVQIVVFHAWYTGSQGSRNSRNVSVCCKEFVWPLNLCKPFPLRTSSRLLMQTKADQWNSKNFRPCPLASTSDLCRATMACPWSFSILFPPKAWQSPWPRGSWQLRNYPAVLFVKGHTCRCPVALSMKGNPGILVVRCCKKGDTFMQDAAIWFFWDQSVCYSACYMSLR